MGKNVAYAAGQSVATPETSQSGRKPGVHHGVNTARVETPHRHMGRHFPAAARPALAHPVISCWTHDNAKICRAGRGVPQAESSPLHFLLRLRRGGCRSDCACERACSVAGERSVHRKNKQPLISQDYSSLTIVLPKDNWRVTVRVESRVVTRVTSRLVEAKVATGTVILDRLAPVAPSENGL